MTTALAILALMVAVVTAIVQAIQSHRQSSRDADIQERLATVEEARRRDEEAPKLTLRYVPDPEDVDGCLEWVNQGPHDLDDVSFELIERSGAGRRLLRGVRFVREGLTVTEESLGPLKIGEPVAHGLVRTPGSEDRGGTVRFRMRCTRGDDVWHALLECNVPPLR